MGKIKRPHDWSIECLRTKLCRVGMGEFGRDQQWIMSKSEPAISSFVSPTYLKHPLVMQARGRQEEATLAAGFSVSRIHSRRRRTLQ